MKRLVRIILVVAFAIFALVDTIREFIANDTIYYYRAQPHRFWLVAVIAIAGGLVTLGFALLSPGLQRRAKLFALGSGGILVLLADVFFAFQFAVLPAELQSAIPRQIPLILLTSSVATAGLLWFEFYQILRRHHHVA